MEATFLPSRTSFGTHFTQIYTRHSRIREKNSFLSSPMIIIIPETRRTKLEMNNMWKEPFTKILWENPATSTGTEHRPPPENFHRNFIRWMENSLNGKSTKVQRHWSISGTESCSRSVMFWAQRMMKTTDTPNSPTLLVMDTTTLRRKSTDSVAVE